MPRQRPITDWLPASRREMDERGWDAADVILVSGDAYVDHPAFGHAVIARVLEQEGCRVAVLAQPNWRDDLRDFQKLGRPRLFFGVTAGCMDSMVNHYTAAQRRRSEDAYTPGGAAGFRPDRATQVYVGVLKRLFPDVPVVIGGVEASLRRMTHYDYWSDSLRPSLLVDSGADLLVYGMGEPAVRGLVRLLRRGVPFASIRTLPQSALLLGPEAPLPSNRHWETRELASHEACLSSQETFALQFRMLERSAGGPKPVRWVQRTGEHRVVINPPFPVMTASEIDASFDLPYTRLPHPRYGKRGRIPAFEMIRFSITLHRGCFGGCSFCAIAAHQGRQVASRSEGSILREVDAVTRMPGFAGTLSDLGGPTANMYRMQGLDPERCRACARASCLHPRICANLSTDHGPLLRLYGEVERRPGVRHAFVGSGVRHDLLVGRPEAVRRRDSLDAYTRQLVLRHVSGRLKVAPEHSSDRVLRLMRKPPFRLFEAFKERFDALCRKEGLPQELVPYFISAHPGCTVEDMAELAGHARRLGVRLEQVQAFTPVPMTLSSVMYFAGMHPDTLRPLHAARTRAERAEQHRLFFAGQAGGRGPGRCGALPGCRGAAGAGRGGRSRGRRWNGRRARA